MKDSGLTLELQKHTKRQKNFSKRMKVNYEGAEAQKSGIGIGKASAQSMDSEKKTWDGFGKFNNVPINPDAHISETPKMTPEELLREKFIVLRKLEALEKKGAKLSKKYSMDSPLAEMKGEYEMVIAEKESSNSCKFQGRMLMAAITGIEFLNNRFD